MTSALNWSGFDDDLRRVVERSWNVAALRAQYLAFLAEAKPVAKRWANLDPSEHLQQAFVDYPYLDPGLPLELLPRRWKGRDASQTFFEVHELLSEPARRYFENVTSVVATRVD